MGCGMMLFLHLYLKYTQPLFIQALMGIKSLYDSKIVALYILGKPAEGDLKRPFKAAPGLFGGERDFWLNFRSILLAGIEDCGNRVLSLSHESTVQFNRSFLFSFPYFLIRSASVANFHFVAGGGEPQTDKAAIDEAEKRVEGKKKDE